LDHAGFAHEKASGPSFSQTVLPKSNAGTGDRVVLQPSRLTGLPIPYWIRFQWLRPKHQHQFPSTYFPGVLTLTCINSSYPPVGIMRVYTQTETQWHS
jgi:hypothetical protein